MESGSTDGTAGIADRLAQEHGRVRSCHQARREGMGSAIRHGIAQARMEYLFWTDGDHPVDMDELYRVLRDDWDADLIAGYRLKRGEGAKRYLYSKAFNLMVNAVYRLGLRDINFAFKVYQRRVFDAIQIESQGSFFSAEICIKAKSRGFRVKEVGIPYQARDPGDSKLGNLGTILGILRDWWRLRRRLRDTGKEVAPCPSAQRQPAP